MSKARKLADDNLDPTCDELPGRLASTVLQEPEGDAEADGSNRKNNSGGAGVWNRKARVGGPSGHSKRSKPDGESDDTSFHGSVLDSRRSAGRQ